MSRRVEAMRGAARDSVNLISVAQFGQMIVGSLTAVSTDVVESFQHRILQFHCDSNVEEPFASSDSQVRRHFRSDPFVV
jgi:hypothetical protein